jgi:hypothetical protein
MHDFAMSSTNPFDDIILPMTSSDLLSPLSANGTIQPYNAVLNNDFANITASIAANIKSTVAIGTPNYFYMTNAAGVISGLPQSIIYDPWGHLMHFAFNTVVIPITSPVITGAGTYFNCIGTLPVAMPQTNILFSLQSYGPDNISNNADDLYSYITLSQLVPYLTPQC